ncbi:MAG: hypothetical protein KAH38_01240, partial [Candidatus Hydrogenedentes bacterium]|nr:hypothetical protein [Candidatus Hydrogenedentota bacterium]
GNNWQILGDDPDNSGAQSWEAKYNANVSHVYPAAGNFTGHQEGNTSAVMQLMLSFTSSIIDYNTGRATESRLWQKCINFQGGNSVLYSRATAKVICDDIPSCAVAYDGDGDSYYLGTPAHITIYDLLKVDYVIQEPPKHLDYLPNDPQTPEDAWGVHRVSAWPAFAVEFKDSTEQTLETTSKSHSSWGLGGSVEASSSNTLSGGNASILKVTASLDVALKVGYDHESRKSSWNNQYSSTTLSQTVTTTADDYVDGKLHLIDVWRYPIVGLTTAPTKDDPALNVYQDIVIPGPTIDFNGTDGFSNETWYQPVHINRNILSYPAAASFNPTDLGEFNILTEEDPIQDLMNDGATNYSWGSLSTVTNIDWTTTAGSGSEKSYEHKMNESLDIAIGVKAEGKVFPALAGSTDNKIKVNIHSNQSWGASEIAKNTNTSSSGIRLTVPGTQYPDWGYSFKTAVYVAANGTFKVVHATNPRGGAGETWWSNQYGRVPDLSLALPHRFSYHVLGAQTWYTAKGDPDPDVGNTPETIARENRERKQMRGCFLRHVDVNPDTGEKDLFGGALVDGDVVEIVARVYNFSLALDPVGPFDVRFEYVLLDPQSLIEITPRQHIDTARIALDVTDIISSVCQSPMEEVAVQWNTSGLGGRIARIYVTVDPWDEVPDELHEWKVDGERLFHGNNEGYWPWGADLPILTGGGSKSNEPLAVAMDEYSLAIKMPSGFRTKSPVQLTCGQTYPLRATIYSNSSSAEQYCLLFKDGSTEDGGKTIALKIVHGIPEEGAYIWTEWTPQEPGEYTLQAGLV